MKIISLMMVVTGLFLTGCASLGHDYNEKNVDQLKPGVTTEAQAIALLEAAPTTRTYQADGSYMAAWQYTSASFMSVNDNKLLYLMFNKDKIFTRMVSNTISR